MASLFRARNLLLLLTLFAASGAAAEITFAPNGEVVIPKGDWETDAGKFSATFRAARWGMYSLVAEDGGPELKATVNGEGPRRAGKGTLGDFYLEKAGRCTIVVSGKSAKAVESLKLVPACEGTPVVQKGAEAIELDARDSVVEGVMLRYEPNPKKLCLGYWGNPRDTPRWDFTVTTPGTYEVILTQGCGRGAGGSTAVVEVADAKLEFVVEDTGGYQNWKERPLGKVVVKEAGKKSLRVRVVKKARGIMDIRRIVLKPVAK